MSNVEEEQQPDVSNKSSYEKLSISSKSSESSSSSRSSDDDSDDDLSDSNDVQALAGNNRGKVQAIQARMQAQHGFPPSGKDFCFPV
jgi:hypothetical protein